MLEGKKTMFKNMTLKNLLYKNALCIFILTYAFINFLNINQANAQEAGTYLGGNNYLVKSVALLPFENLTENANAVSVVTDSIKKELKGKGWVLLARDETVEDFLASKRIRNTGSISRLAAREMGKNLGVDAIVVGSVNQFNSAAGTLNVGVSIRLVSTLDGKILWAENTTYSGKEFVYLFGLGQIKSYAKLSQYVARDLVKNIADKFFMDESVLSPFEIERVITYPTISKAGEKIDIKVKISPIQEDAKDVKIIFEGEEISLEKEKEGLFIGSITAPNDEGVYTFDLLTTDSYDEEYEFNSIATVNVDITPPKVKMDLDKNVFTTRVTKKGNKGGSNGSILFEPKLLNLEEVYQWKMEIINNEGNIIRHDRGFHKVPSKLFWYGETQDKGKEGDGTYTARFSVEDRAGNSSYVEQIIKIKNSLPKMIVDMDFQENETVVFHFNTQEDDEMIEEFTFTLIDRYGNVIRNITGTTDDQGKPQPITVKLDKTINLSKMFYSVEAQDFVGNVYMVKQTVPAIMSTSTPFAKNDKKKRNVLTKF